ncbi:MAG: c-type cytochrome [Gammaproteobacteria bacterium]
MHRIFIRAILSAIAVLGLFTTAQAAGNVEDAIKYRHAVMEEMASHMSALTLILFDKVDGAAFAQGHVDALARAGAEMAVLFPEGSGGDETEALPVIWSNADDFAKAVDKAQTAFDAFAAAVPAGDRGATLKAFADAGKACKGCHEVFRAEEHDEDH